MILLHEVQEQVKLTDSDRSQKSSNLVGDGVMVGALGRPPPPATPGSTFLALPEPAWASPVTPCPGCPGLSPMQGTGPWGPPFQVHVHPYSSSHPRSVCAPFWSFLIMELKPAGRRLGPWLHQAEGEVEASLVNNSEKQLEAARSPCAYVNSGASSKGHSLQAVLYWACQG